MAIVLDGYALSPHMLWTDRHSYNQVEQTSLRTLGGRLKVFSHGLVKGRPITLEAVIDQGWLTLLQVKAVEARASVPGAVYSLVVGDESFNVMFRHTDGLPFEAAPLISRIEEADSDYYTCTLKLITV